MVSLRIGLVLAALMVAGGVVADILQLWHDSCLGSRLLESLPVDQRPRDRSERQGISCRDELNRRIPWSITYKLPKLQSNANPLIQQGKGYTYLHPEFLALKMKWRLSNKGIDEGDSMLGKTLKQRGISVWLSYNDQYPESTHGGGAHSKGVVMFHPLTRTAVWIVHSVPKLPVDSGVYFYPPTGFNNGQMIMCMNMPISTLLEVVTRLHKIQPHVQSRSRMTDGLLQAALRDPAHQQLFLSLGNSPPPGEDESYVHTMRIVQDSMQQQFRAFFKPPNNPIDIYSDYLAPAQGAHIQVQSWFRGRGGRLCKVVNNQQAGFYNVFACVQDVKTVRIEAEDCDGRNVTIEFSSSKDHSKWAVTEDIMEPWVCVADLNRMVSQKFRGGSAVCILHPDVWTVFNRTVNGLVQSETPQTSSGTHYVHDELRY